MMNIVLMMIPIEIAYTENRPYIIISICENRPDTYTILVQKIIRIPSPYTYTSVNSKFRYPLVIIPMA